MTRHTTGKNGLPNPASGNAGGAVSYARLLADDAQAKRNGSPLLTAPGKRHVRRLAGAALRPPAKRPRDGGPHSQPRPRWDSGQGQLWLGADELCKVANLAPAISPFLDAFEATRWTTEPIPIPLPREAEESDADFRVRVVTTVKNLNRKLRDTVLHFRLTRDRKWVCWEVVPKKRRRRGKRQ
jgi:hypothetical protein